MCTIIGISSASACGEAEGGIKALYIAEYSSLGFTVASKKISALTGALKKFEFTKDNTAFFNSTGERPSLSVHRYAQETLMEFNQTDIATDAADELKACCKLVGIALLNNGLVRFIGLQFTTSQKTAVEVSVQECRATVSDLSDVGGNPSKVQIRLIAQSKNTIVGLNSVINEGYLDALVA